MFFIWPQSELFFTSFGPFKAIFGVGVRLQKTFLGLTYVDNQLCFFKYSSTCLFLVQQHFGPLLHFSGPLGLSFWPFWANLWVGVRFKTFLEPTYVDNQLWFWKVSLIFSFLIWSNLGPFLNYFWAFRGYFLGWGQIQKIYCYLPKLTTNFGFGCTAISFCFQFGHIWGLFCTFLGPSGLFFGPLGLIVWLGSGSKTFLEPTYVDNQLWFWKVSLIFSFLIWSNLGPFLNYFWAFRGYFLGWGQIQKHFWNLPM